MSKKILSIFVDESGDANFYDKKESPFFIVSLVIHNQKINLQKYFSNIEKCPVFHFGPLIRREEYFINIDLKHRQNLFNKFIIFISITPIKQKTFIYKKKDFNNSLNIFFKKITKDFDNFISNNLNYFIYFDKIIIYYDNGQQLVKEVLKKSFGNSGLNFSFKENVKPDNYRLFQVADFITMIYLIDAKLKTFGKLSKSEEKFIDKRHFKNVYLRTIKKKEI